MVTSYVLNGQIEILEKMDFSVYSKSSIEILIEKAKVRLEQLHSKMKRSTNTNITYYMDNYNNMNKCIEFLGEVLNKEYTWENDDITIYSTCFCVPSADYPDIYYHKVFDKKTGTYTAVYCHKLAEIAKKVGLSNAHFTGEASPNYREEIYCENENDDE